MELDGEKFKARKKLSKAGTLWNSEYMVYYLIPNGNVDEKNVHRSFQGAVLFEDFLVL